MSSEAPTIEADVSDSTFSPHGTYGLSLSSDALLSLGSMEGLYTDVVSPAAAVPTAARGDRWLLLPGYLLAGGVALLAYLIHFLPVAPFGVEGVSGVRHPISAAIVAIVVGLLLRNTLALPDVVKAGCRRIVKGMIPIAIVCTGAGLNLVNIASVGSTALLITVVCVAVAFAAAYYCGRLLGLKSKTALLLGAGTGICGNSAIVAVAPLLEAEDDDIALSIGTVNLFGLLAMLAWPVIGGWLALTSERFGVWSGTTIHAVPQVVAAGFAFGPDAGALATLVKLVRVTLLAPLVFILALLSARRHARYEGGDGSISVHYARLVPWFVWGFVLLALLNTFGLIPTLSFEPGGSAVSSTHAVSISLGEMVKQVGKILLTLAMAAIGLEVNLRQLAAVGGRALGAGLASTLVLGAVSLGLIMLLM